MKIISAMILMFAAYTKRLEDLMINWIKLLSPKTLADFSPEEYKNYVKSLYFKKQKKEPLFRVKVKKKELEWKKTEKGNLSIVVRRDPKFITRAELTMMIEALAFDFTEEQVMKKLKKVEIRESLEMSSS